mmetsp:Transcript_16230/g.52880  ORF Transcript_16230/g.52880 Transcript_16230/m.52880 type:complete len:203 (+) Transcript_16230:1962-2570(+)
MPWPPCPKAPPPSRRGPRCSRLWPPLTRPSLSTDSTKSSSSTASRATAWPRSPRWSCSKCAVAWRSAACGSGSARRPSSAWLTRGTIRLTGRGLSAAPSATLCSTRSLSCSSATSMPRMVRPSWSTFRRRRRPRPARALSRDSLEARPLLHRRASRIWAYASDCWRPTRSSRRQIRGKIGTVGRSWTLLRGVHSSISAFASP